MCKNLFPAAAESRRVGEPFQSPRLGSRPVAFGGDGLVNVRFDCNRGRGSWKSSGPNQLQFGPLALTRALCPPGSLHDRMVKDWEFVRSYTLKDGHLFLALMADGGIYEFDRRIERGRAEFPGAFRLI